jgi:hypothetical protein
MAQDMVLVIDNLEGMLNPNILASLKNVIVTNPDEDHRESLCQILTAFQGGINWAEEGVKELRHTPFAGLAKALSKDRAGLIALMTLLVSILQLIISLQSTSAQPISRKDMEEIIQKVFEHKEQQTPPVIIKPPSDCK